MASSSSARDSQYCSRWKYDVFLSFRGADTRRTFTGHLYEGLKNRGIFTFQDDKRLEHGDSISEELLKAIEKSQISIIVFSKNYATSRWCLNELVKIMECKVKNGQIVIPVFYDVDPSHVRYQSESFKEAFAKHESRYKDDVEGMQKVQGWRTSLTAAANLKGYDIRDGIESECIRELVDDVSSKLCKTCTSYLQDIVGIDTHLEKVKSLLEMETNDVRILGIWGMGGVGKTTLARAVFDTLSPQFQGACFLADVKETNTNKMHSLQNILLSELLREKKEYVHNKEDGKRLMAYRLRLMNVLIVLDDIDHHDHWEYLAGDLRWFGSGSRIIATTRNKQIIGRNNVVYEVTTLLEHDSIQLFNHYAFKDEAPDEHNKELALEVVSHAKGLPLALRLWGIWLHNQDITMWREVVDMIKRESSPDIVKNLKISFEGLQDKEKTIFLDIACFFRGMRKDETITILESYDLYARIRLRGLIEKSLVFISSYDTIQMHDLIQDMGRYVVKMQKDSGNPSRVWNIEDFEDMMVNNTGTMAMEAIWCKYIGNPCFSREAMQNMKRLRILSFYPRDSPSYSEDIQNGSIEYLPNNLCYIVWYHYPWKSLPGNFNPRRLVHLELGSSSLHHLWNETKPLPSLRKLDLSYSESLKTTPDFRGMSNLEYLILQGCTSLEEVHHSLEYCGKLIELNLGECKSLKTTPDFKRMSNLEYLILQGCTSLEEVHHSLEYCGKLIKLNLGDCESLKTTPDFKRMSNLVDLYLKRCTSLEEVHHSLEYCGKLIELNLGDCDNLKTTPDFKRMSNLEYLILEGCMSLEEVHHSLEYCGKLIELNLCDCESLERFPYVNVGSLESLDLHCCSSLEKFPEFVGIMKPELKITMSHSGIRELPLSIIHLQPHLTELHLSGMSNLVSLPSSICKLKGLVKLDVLFCSKLESLPEEIGDLENLEYLDARYTLISRPPSSIVRLNKLKFLTFSKEESEDRVYFVFPQVNEGLCSLEILDLSNCNLIDGELPEDIGSLSSLKELRLHGNNFEHLPQSIAQLGALQCLDVSDCKNLTQLPKFPQQLSRICAYWSNDWICNSLFQNISSLRVFTSWAETGYIPSWFHHQGMGTSVSVNLPENWYLSDNFLGFAVCYSGKVMDDITVRLIPLCDDGMSPMTQKLALYNHSGYADLDEINFLLVPLGGLWDASNANGKTPNDYGCFSLFFGEEKKIGVRLLYKDESELCIGIRRNRYEEASGSSSKKQRSLCPTSPGIL